MAILHVTHVKAIGPYVLDVTFEDSTHKRVDVRPLLGRGVFRRLLDPEEFAKARVDYGTVVWPGQRDHPDEPHITDLDFAPEALYELPEVETV